MRNNYLKTYLVSCLFSYVKSSIPLSAKQAILKHKNAMVICKIFFINLLFKNYQSDQLSNNCHPFSTNFT